MTDRPRGVKVFCVGTGGEEPDCYPGADEVVLVGENDALAVRDGAGTAVAVYASGCWHHAEIGVAGP
jgi:uncharacterized protein (DUF779 family)